MVEQLDQPAHFLQHLVSEGNKQNFSEGDNVHFEARVGPATDGTLTVEWFHNDKPLVSGHRFKPSFDFGHIVLDILYVYPEDSGVYKCVTRNDIGSAMSQIGIQVTGKPSPDYHSQLPKEIIGGTRKIGEMEAMWNRAPDHEVEVDTTSPRRAPDFILKPKPCTVVEGSSAQFNCRIVGNPRPQVTWSVNNQTVVNGSRYKLTYDGMYHLTIPKCLLSDTGVVKVYAKNQLGDCSCTIELRVESKVGDYRGVLKGSPISWHQEQSSKLYHQSTSEPSSRLEHQLMTPSPENRNHERISTPSKLSDSPTSAVYQTREEQARQQQQSVQNQHQMQQYQYQQQQQQQQQQHQQFQRPQYNQGQQVLVEEHMKSPEYIQVQPCQTIDGDEKYQCTFEGDPKLTISWCRENKMRSPSNMYNIVPDLKEEKPALTIQRVNINTSRTSPISTDIITESRSPTNLSVNSHIPSPQTSQYASHSGQFNHNREHNSPNMDVIVVGGGSPSYTTTTNMTTASRSTSGGSHQMINQQTGYDGAGPSTSDSHRVGQDLYTLLILDCAPGGEGGYDCVANSETGETRCYSVSDERISASRTPEQMSAIRQRIQETPRQQEPGKIQLDPNYDPLWLSMRQPDVESVQSDPLYRDLMLELQRLEEGVIAKPETPQPEQEIFQKPVFGQPIKPERIEVNECENVEFVGRLEPASDPSMKVEWIKNGQPLQQSSRYTNEFDFGVVRFCIKRCDADDSGVYQCKATNSRGQAISTVSLRVTGKGNVQCETLNPAGLEQIRQLENPRPVDHVVEQALEQPPKFLTHIVDYVEKDEGESVHFECCLAPVDDPNLKTEWLFNGRPLVTGSRFHTIDDFGFIVLDIDWLFPRDTGEYICRATNKYGTDITRTVLRVKPDKNIELDSQLDNPQIVDKLRQLEFPDVIHETVVEEPDRPAHFVQHLVSEGNKQNFSEGDNVHFEARVGPATDGTLTVEWFHNDKPLVSGHRFKPSFDFGHIVLDILYVYPEDSGVYKCVTRNATGSDVSQINIQVSGKPSPMYQSQLPKEMVGGVQKISEMEAMWNRAPDPDEEEEPTPRRAPEFVLKPKPCEAFEGSCARFCCRIVGNPKPRPQWMVNNQAVVSGSRYKLTYDGMYHLIIPKCQLSDAGIVKVYARNLLGDCFCTTELRVKRKVDDYRSVLKNSPNPWYDEQSLKLYQRQRSQDLTDDEEFLQNYQQLTQRLQVAPEQQSTSPFGNQVIGYMEPGTPDVNLLARTQSPLVEPGDLHPVVTERQVVMAPAPSTIQRALKVKDSINVSPERPFQLADADRKTRQVAAATSRLNMEAQLQSTASGQYLLSSQNLSPDIDQQQLPRSSATDQRVFGLSSHQIGDKKEQVSSTDSQHQFSGKQSEFDMSQVSTSGASSRLDHRMPPPSPENKDYGKEIHSHIHKQTQMERRANKQIIREIIEKETFEQEHSGLTKDNIVRDDSTERGSSPSVMSEASSSAKRQQSLQYQKQQQQQQHQQQYQDRYQSFQGQQHQSSEERHVLIEEHMRPPEFIQKIQPSQAIDGDEATFECIFEGDPKPTISWFRENKMIKPSNLYSIITDLKEGKSTLIIKRVNINSNAVYTVKAKNLAGSAKSSANLVVEPHPLPQTSRQAGHARQVDYNQELSSPNLDVVNAGEGVSSSFKTTTTTTTSTATSSGNSNLLMSSHKEQQQQKQQEERDGDDTSTSDSQRVVKSILTRKISSEEMAALIRKSPEGSLPPTFLHTLHDTTVSPGDLARLDARLIGSQPMEMRWVKDGQRVRADKSHKMLLEGDLYTLLILECSPRDEGNYECVASNRIGEARCGACLSVADRRASASRTPDQMSAADIYTTGSSPQMMAVGSSRTSSSESQWRQQQQQHQQHLQQEQHEQQSWSASSSAGQKTHYGLTRHQYNPLLGQYTSALLAGDRRQPELPKVIKRLENQHVTEGKSLTLRCQISSFPMAEVHWYKEGDKLIKPSKYFRIFKDNDETYCLKILEVFPEDQGDYKCVARAPNGQSQVETKATISVIPNSPR